MILAAHPLAARPVASGQAGGASGVTHSALILDACLSSESLSPGFSLSTTLTDAASSSEALSITLALGGTLTDAAQSSEVLNAVVIETIALTDASTSTETISARIILGAAVTDAAVSSETITAQGTTNVPIAMTDAAQSSETLALRAAFGATITDASASSETISADILKAWVPTHIGSALTNWFKADSLALANGSPVTSWADSSGTNNGATGASEKPTFATAQLNNRPAIQFRGGSQHMTFGTTGMATGNDARSVFTVTKALDSSTRDFMFSYGGVGNNSIFDFELNGWTGGMNGKLIVHTWDDGVVTQAGGFAGSPHIFEATYPGNAGTGSIRLFVDGDEKARDYAQIYGAVNANSPLTTTPGSTGYLGTRANFTSFAQMDLFEVIYVNRDVTLDERQRVEGYLAHKYGLTALLAPDHVYRTTPPTLGAGALLSLALTDSAQSGETVTPTVIEPIALTDAAQSGEALSIAIIRNSTVADASVSSETLAPGLRRPLTLNDAAQSAETITAGLRFSLAQTDASTSSETINATNRLSPTVTDSAISGEALSINAAIFATMVNPAQSGETVSPGLLRAAELTDTGVSASSALARLMVSVEALSEAIAEDVISGRLTARPNLLAEALSGQLLSPRRIWDTIDESVDTWSDVDQPEDTWTPIPDASSGWSDVTPPTDTWTTIGENPINTWTPVP